MIKLEKIRALIIKNSRKLFDTYEIIEIFLVQYSIHGLLRD